jgi:hypothetical protein
MSFANEIIDLLANSKCAKQCKVLLLKQKKINACYWQQSPLKSSASGMMLSIKKYAVLTAQLEGSQQ